MGKFALQTSPYNFLILRIGPWRKPFPLLLCSLITGALSSSLPSPSFPPLTGSTPIPFCFFPSLSLLSTDAGSSRRQAAQAAAAWVWRAGACAQARGAARRAGTGGRAEAGGASCGPRRGGASTRQADAERAERGGAVQAGRRSRRRARRSRAGRG
jgi:hypothetical protein